MKTIKKILIANRGEIASRIIKTCKEMRIATVAIFSEHDSNAPYVGQADESYSLGSGNITQTYLNHDAVIEIALRADVDAIHPGYGFLSENANFVTHVEKSGIIFIGPSADAMIKLGNKTEARAIASSLSIPIIQGTTDPLESIEQAEAVAAKIKYPVLLKAAGGGGGKGMRIVHSQSDLASSFRTAQSEASSSFGDSRIYAEKYLDCPKHIEVQILADKYGTVLHLGERECSVQRRHQKIIEESPSTAIDQGTRDELTQAALRLIRHTGYYGAGTVEFLVDQKKNFYFLEVNTRLQVEHPVSEMRTGIDLVREQIQVAAGERLSFTQSDINFNGHAIECRIYAEDPSNSFYPSTGTIAFVQGPSGLGIREDIGFQQGFQVTPYYDPLLSKLIVWGRSRDEALNRMSRALGEYSLYGVRNNVALCSWIINHSQFRDGSYHTKFLDECLQDYLSIEPDKEITKIAGIAAILKIRSSAEPSNTRQTSAASGWKSRRNEYLR